MIKIYILFLISMFIFLSSSYSATWSQKANLTGSRETPVSFSIGTKGYIGTGYNGGTFTFYKDFWEFDRDSNVWTQKADFAGGNRTGAVGFSIGNKGYIGTGAGP